MGKRLKLKAFRVEHGLNQFEMADKLHCSRATYASIEKLNKAVGYEPKTTIREGIPVFAKWYREYHGL